MINKYKVIIVKVYQPNKTKFQSWDNAAITFLKPLNSDSINQAVNEDLVSIFNEQICCMESH